jgi:hypothetical protein
MLPLVMMMVLSSSSAVGAFLMMGGEEEDSGGTGGPNNQNDDQGEDEDGSTSQEPEELEPEWTLLLGKKITGGTLIKTVSKGNMTPCKEACFEDKDCKGFHYRQFFGDKCSLYSGDIDFEDDETNARSSYKIGRNYS